MSENWLACGLEQVCDVIDSVLDGECRVLGGLIINDVIVVTVNNGYEATVQQVKEVASFFNGHDVLSCRGVIAINTCKLEGLEITLAHNTPRPYINPRLALAAKQS